MVNRHPRATGVVVALVGAVALWVAFSRPPERPQRVDPLGLLVTVSHILVTHAFSQETESRAFSGAWRRTTRTPEEARQLAENHRLALLDNPDTFSDRASLSDDLATATSGGSLGTIPPEALPPTITRALRETPVDGISAVVETSLGFHVLQRRVTPAAAQVSGIELVVSYRSSLGLFLRPERVDRSREAARTRAWNLAAHARKIGGLARLVPRESDHESYRRGGDIGNWSTHKPEHNARTLETLSNLPIGGISDPIDIECGFRILERTPVRARKSYTTRVLLFPFDARDPHSKELARSLAHDTVLKHGGVSNALAARAAETFTGTFESGREPIGLLPAVSSLAIGSSLPKALELVSDWALVERIDPSEMDAPAVALERAMAMVSPQNAADLARRFAGVVRERGGTSSAEGAKLEAIVLAMVNDIESGTNPHIAYQAAIKTTAQSLGPQRARHLQDLALEWLDSGDARSSGTH